MTTSALLAVENLSVAFRKGADSVQVVNNVSFAVNAGDRLGIVGESGSGKSVTALSIMGLHDPDRVHYPSGKILLRGINLLQQPESRLQDIRGRQIAMIFQEPMMSMNPVYPVGRQLVEPLMLHQGFSFAAARQRMLELLDAVELRRPADRFSDYPHMFSGGELQRIMIAMALACNPDILLADEPTTALDVTIQAEVLKLLRQLQRDFNMAVVLISHDLNLVQHFAERIIVMQKGDIVEQNTSAALFAQPQHEYTRLLIAARPGKTLRPPLIGADRSPTLLAVRQLHCHFPIRKGFLQRKVDSIRALDGVDLQLHAAETLGIVGESGSGKSTLARCILRLQRGDGGIAFNGHDMQVLRDSHLRGVRKHLQIVFQDPYSSLSPRMTIRQILAEGLRIHFPALDDAEREARFTEVLQQVALPPDCLQRYPHEFSGGQRQRIAIARVMVLKPRLVILDEPTSALDVSVQQQLLALLKSLQQQHGISYLFISHDLRVVGEIAHRVVVMQRGRIVEHGETAAVFRQPQAEYTQRLLAAAML